MSGTTAPAVAALLTIQFPATGNINLYFYAPNRVALDRLIRQITDKALSATLVPIFDLWPAASSGWIGLCQVMVDDGDTMFVARTLNNIARIPENVLASQRSHPGGCIIAPDGQVVAFNASLTA